MGAQAGVAEAALGSDEGIWVLSGADQRGLSLRKPVLCLSSRATCCPGGPADGTWRISSRTPVVAQAAAIRPHPFAHLTNTRCTYVRLRLS